MRVAGWILLGVLLAAPLPAAALSARINQISDFDLPDWSLGGGPINAHIDVCVHAAGVLSSGNYIVTVTALPSYVLLSGLNMIPFQLYWEDSGATHLGSNGGTQLVTAVPLLGQQNASASNNNCPSGPNARLYLKITEAAMNAAPAGDYSNSILILIAPT